MCVVKIAGIVLAAGFSRRLGQAKQNVVIGRQTLLERAVATATAASLDPVLVVVREPAKYARLASSTVALLQNSKAEEGMAASVRVGAAAAMAAGVKGAVMLTCDQPLLQPDHLLKLIRDPMQRMCSAYAGRRGVPAYFPLDDLPQLLALQGDKGARELLMDAHAVVAEELALDIDEPADLERARTQLIYESPD